MKILILFGHPAFQNSNFNKRMVQGLEKIENVTFHDLYEAYPELDIDIDYEQELLSQHDCIVFQHPLHWYSAPAIFKEWQDLVLEHGWAFGSLGNALQGKWFFNAITTGAAKEAFEHGKFQNHTMKEFMAPFIQMAITCKMIALPPFVIHGTHLTTEERIQNAQQQYHSLLNRIAKNKVNLIEAGTSSYLNNVL